MAKELTAMRWFMTVCLAGLALAGSAGAAPPAKKPPAKGAAAKGQAPREFLPPTLSWLRQVEGAQMLGAILSGNPPSGDNAWFHPGQTRYGWRWLAGRFDRDHDGAVSREEFTGSPEAFERLDRDHDGRLTPADFDWSGRSPLTQQMQLVNRLFRRADADHDERLSAAEWQALFKEATRGKDGMSREALHALLFPPPPKRPKGPAGEGPNLFTMIKGVLTGELGSLCEGPALGGVAPDFTLKTHDDGKAFTLSAYRGKKPVVLVFGSFT
jgi:hypothetical protein